MIFLSTQSQYIFDEAVKYPQILAGITALLVLAGIIMYRTTAGMEADIRKRTRIVWFAMLTAAFAGLSYCLLQPYAVLRNIEKRGISTAGQLTWKYRESSSDNWQMAYRYHYNGRTYYSNNVHWQPGAQGNNATPLNCYRVVFDSLNPGNSFMDLLEPSFCDEALTGTNSQKYVPALDCMYIFNRWDKADHDTTIFLFSALLLIILAAFSGSRYYRDKNGAQQPKHTPAIFAIIFLFILSCAVLHDHIQDNSIRQHAATSNGFLYDKHWHSGKGSGWRYQYYYTVNGIKYTGEKAYSLNENIKDSIQEGNCYMVVYDSSHPNNSFIDLHEPMPCNSDINIR